MLGFCRFALVHLSEYHWAAKFLHIYEDLLKCTDGCAMELARCWLDQCQIMLTLSPASLGTVHCFEQKIQLVEALPKSLWQCRLLSGFYSGMARCLLNCGKMHDAYTSAKKAATLQDQPNSEFANATMVLGSILGRPGEMHSLCIRASTTHGSKYAFISAYQIRSQNV